MRATTLRGGGGRCNGHSIRVGAKCRLEAAIAATAQAEAGQVETYGRIVGSVAAMLAHVLLVRASVRVSSTRRTVGLEVVPARFFPAGVSRATVAAAMLDEAESPRFAGRTAVPLAR